jgi:hypothetical protein
MATRTESQSPALYVAESHDLIRVHGACENNLKDVSVEIPKRRLMVFTGRLRLGQGPAADDLRDDRLVASRPGPHAARPPANPRALSTARDSGSRAMQRSTCAWLVRKRQLPPEDRDLPRRARHRGSRAERATRPERAKLAWSLNNPL